MRVRVTLPALYWSKSGSTTVIEIVSPIAKVLISTRLPLQAIVPSLANLASPTTRSTTPDALVPSSYATCKNDSEAVSTSRSCRYDPVNEPVDAPVSFNAICCKIAPPRSDTATKTVSMSPESWGDKRGQLECALHCAHCLTGTQAHQISIRVHEVDAELLA